MCNRWFLPVLVLFLCGCATSQSSNTDTKQPLGKPLVASGNLTGEWRGAVDVLHNHKDLPLPGSVNLWIVLNQNEATLRLSGAETDWTAPMNLQVLYHTPNYASLFAMRVGPEFTEELSLSISILDNGGAQVTYLRIVDNYNRADAHERRNFNVYAFGRLAAVSASDGLNEG